MKPNEVGREAEAIPHRVLSTTVVQELEDWEHQNYLCY